jgi:hypothetical protein
MFVYGDPTDSRYIHRPLIFSFLLEEKNKDPHNDYGQLVSGCVKSFHCVLWSYNSLKHNDYQLHPSISVFEKHF